MSNNKQKLELTWVGKNNPEYDIANIEPRILEERVDLSHGDKDTENMIIHGDNLLALKALLPEYEGRVKCIYIDPPYNTGNMGFKYDDSVEHSIWLSLMKPRLELFKILMRDDGVIFVHLDDNETAYLKVLMDEVFGRDNFIACLPIVMNLKGNQDQFGFAGTHEYILSFAKNKAGAKMYPFYITDEELKGWDEDEVGPWKKGATLKRTGADAPREKRPNGFFPIFVSKNNSISLSRENIDDIEILPITDGKEMSWRWSKEKILKDINDIIVSRNGNDVSLYKKQRPELGDLPTKKPKSIFYKPEYSSGNGTSQIKKIFGEKSFSYPKPEELISDILQVSTKENDLVLDSFLGSGTTAAVSNKMGRKYIGIEMGEHAYTHCKVRLDKVIDGTDQGGISKTVGWKGGGGYKFYELAPSFVVIDEFGNPVIDSYYNDTKLIRAMCKLTNYIFAPSPADYWKHGKGQGSNSIYVTTQMLSVAMVQQIASRLGTNETLLICPKKFEPGCESVDQRITIKKIPQSVLKACEFGKKEYLLPIKERVLEEADEDDAGSEEN